MTIAVTVDEGCDNCEDGGTGNTVMNMSRPRNVHGRTWGDNSGNAGDELAMVKTMIVTGQSMKRLSV